jgi:ubiquinone/menaquinone biosynthesis C-methylase UbiE
MTELKFGDIAATGYDRTVGEMTLRIVPILLRAAHLKPGQRVLDIATGTGLAAEAAAAVVGPSGEVVAADISTSMLTRARDRLGRISHVTLAVEDGQSLTFSDDSFDAVVCNMGLFYFSDPARGLSEFRRVLRPGARVALTVFTRPDRALVGGLLRAAIAQRVPSKRAEVERVFSVGDERNLGALLTSLGFTNIEIKTETLAFTFKSFEDYFDGVERGAGYMGQEYLALPQEVRRAVREDVRSAVAGTSGKVEVAVEVRVAGANK